jgi:phosphate transport system protein
VSGSIEHDLRPRLASLHRELVDEGGAVRRLVELAVDAIFARNAAQAATVRAADDQIDKSDVLIERHAVRLLTDAIGTGGLSEKDVRMVLTIVKVNNEFERVADLAAFIASMLDSFVNMAAETPRQFRVLANSVIGIVQTTVNCFDRMDVHQARRVLSSDSTTDAFRAAVLRRTEEELAAGVRTVEYAFTVNRVAGALARMAEHCTNVAEQVIYVESGMIVRHADDGAWTEPAVPEFD